MICFQTLVSVLVRNIWTNTYHYLYNHIGQSLADLFRYFRIEDINWLFYSLISAQIKITYGAKHVCYSRKHRSTLLNVHQLGLELGTWSNSDINMIFGTLGQQEKFAKMFHIVLQARDEILTPLSTGDQSTSSIVLLWCCKYYVYV